jgi:hypothetical protein
VRALVLWIVAWSRLASAGDRGLERAPIELLGGHLDVRVLIGSEVDSKRDRVVFNSEPASLILAAHPTELVAGPSLKQAIAAELAKEDPRVATARIEPLVLAKPMVGYSVIPRSRARADELVYAAYIVSPDGTVDVLAFYVEADGASDPSIWIDVARKIATTATPPLLVQTAIGSFVISLPQGSRTRRIHGAYIVRVSDDGGCSIADDGRFDVIPDTADRVPGRILGTSVEWATWSDDDEWAVTDVDRLHIVCASSHPRSLARMRYLAGTLARH